MPVAVLLDLDDTLLDNRAAETAMLDGLATAIERELPELDREQLPERFLTLREPLFRHVLDGDWTHAQYREAHLRAMVEPWGEPSPELVAEAMTLRDGVQAGLEPAAGAGELLRTLRERGHRLGLLTNGPSTLQRAKLERAGWTTAFDALGISEELGAAKPSAAAFHALCDRLGVAAADAVMVGDNLVNDVRGALDAGLRGAIWTPAVPLGDGAPPTGVAVADRLADVPALLDTHESIRA